MSFETETVTFKVNGAPADPITIRFGNSKAEGKFAFACLSDNHPYAEAGDLELWQRYADRALTLWLGKHGHRIKGYILTEAGAPPNRMLEYQ